MQYNAPSLSISVAQLVLLVISLHSEVLQCIGTVQGQSGTVVQWFSAVVQWYSITVVLRCYSGTVVECSDRLENGGVAKWCTFIVGHDSYGGHLWLCSFRVKGTV